ncbi:MAG TPA: hypothetical protein O0Y08_03680 [Methanocorpusculum sp.]|nr:hypothetical protein [Methanocorpusculum sp.]HJJ59944.1 hypothetical protein [Methanocorpusculum sp.]
MIQHTPSSECLIFDLEAYVPEADRHSPSFTLAANPHRAGHTLLGGVFHLFRPVTGEILSVPDFEHHWVWDEGDEAETVASVYRIFEGMRRRSYGKKRFAADPVVSGAGIANFDMPFIYAKCLQYELAAPDEIYDTVCKFRVVDLSTAAIGMLPGTRLYPVPHNRMADYFLPERKEKPTGKIVWQMADEKEYPQIAARCETEVREMKDIASAMLKLILSKP